MKKFLIIICAVALLITGCGQTQQAVAPQKISVKAMKVLHQTINVTHGFPGQVQGIDEVQIRSKVNGTVVEKYIKGGDRVIEGQKLFQIDSRPYETALLSAKADLSKAQSNLRRAQDTFNRNEQLYQMQAIAEQTLVNSREDLDGYVAALDAAQVAIRKAQENLDDTIVYAPMTGRVSLDDVAVGTYAMAGSTTLVTMGTIDPVYVQFSISETEYLNVISKAMSEREQNLPRPNFTMTLILSNNEEYPFKGVPVEADRALSQNSGSINVKAEFDNPQGILLPGMFAHVKVVKESGRNTLLVPQRAVQQLLDQSFVLVVDKDGKSQSKTVELDEKVGSYYIVKSGLSVNDFVIVEGLTNLQSGKDLDVTIVTADEMGFSTEDSTQIVNET
ncbi:MAG: efflux RND transporter periplasmic adaptor subunit [Selenomonadaceae bacterium]|nr:efflux RND transporter periplasmic adaptor subunit [Selenomonadaceae bacterium]